MQSPRRSERAVAIVNRHEIKVGLSISTSDKFQLRGQQALDGILLWQSHVNANGGVRVGNISRPVRLIHYDDGSGFSRAQENVLRLIREDKIDVLFGPYSSGLTMAAAEIAEEHKKLLWNYGGTSDEIFERGWRYILGISSPASDYFRNLPHWLVKEYPSISRICVLHSSKGTFAQQVARGLKEAVIATIPSVELVPFDMRLNDSEAVVSRIRDLSPDAVVLAGNFQDEVAIIRTRPHWPNSVRVTAAVAAGIASFASQLGKMADGILGPTQWEPHASPSTVVGPSSAWFIDSFQKQFCTEPDYIAAGAFATGLILTECIRQTSSLDDHKLRSIASDLDVRTFYGGFHVDAHNGKQMGHRVLLVEWREGTKAVLAC